uniref:Phosphoribosylamine--glycine ligase n=1 Tax=uncultured euryarchaeote Alv-FOS4 TaxID=337893 RepID=Q3SA90_9EURY|nr:phosphoribosylamine-glycine ligase [uncultured euryarchaeote Alv-FOS4]
MTNVLVIGAGGRAHAIAAALKRSGATIYAVMKHRNPGIARLAEDVVIGNHDDPEFVADLKWVRDGIIDFAFISPEAPLINGMVDALEAHGVPSVGPKKNAAIVEGSKEFTRELMHRHGIPGGVEYHTFTDPERLEEFLMDYDKQFVVKPIGVTGGKGVWVMGDHFSTKEEGIEYAKRVLENRIGGEAKVLIEEKLVGEEFTLQVFTDGREVRPMPLVQDFKRAYEGDKGPNTGGMGSYSAADHLLPFVSEDERAEALDILQKIIDALHSEGREYRGVLYGQFMLTPVGSKVVELNCRFGDPEAMNVLSILDSNLVDVADGIINRELPEVRFKNLATVVKYVVPEGYGTAPVKNAEITVNEEAIRNEGALLYYASVNEENGKIYTTTSRSLAVVGLGARIEDAERIAERALGHIQGRVFSRHDIAKREVIEEKVKRMKRLKTSP